MSRVIEKGGNMNDLLKGLSMMFFKLQIVTPGNNANPVLVFSVACAIIGAAAVVLDLLLFLLRGQSLLQLKHGRYTILFLFAWSIGALLIGWIGQMAKIFVVSIAASVMVGFTWPLMFTKILKAKALGEASEEPEQVLIEEE